MRPDTPSATAMRVAIRRAAHQLLDRPLVLDDPLAVRIIGEQAADAIRANPGAQNRGIDRFTRAFLVARSRFAEDHLAAAVAHGVRQYVVLGAGLDTSAYRQPSHQPPLRMFEVDFPATQHWKRQRLADAGITVPDELTYVPLDFTQRTLRDGLVEHGFDVERPACFSWLGVTMYLEAPVVLDTMRFVASLPPGSGIAIDYALSRGALNWVQRLIHDRVAKRVAAAGEPWRSSFTPETLHPELRHQGFSRLEDLDGHDLNARYFAGRADKLRVGAIARVLAAFTG